MTVTLRNGAVRSGDYVGAQDGYVYLREGDTMHVVVQADIATYSYALDPNA